CDGIADREVLPLNPRRLKRRRSMPQTFGSEWELQNPLVGNPPAQQPAPVADPPTQHESPLLGPGKGSPESLMEALGHYSDRVMPKDPLKGLDKELGLIEGTSSPTGEDLLARADGPA